MSVARNNVRKCLGCCLRVEVGVLEDLEGACGHVGDAGSTRLVPWAKGRKASGVGCWSIAECVVWNRVAGIFR